MAATGPCRRATHGRCQASTTVNLVTSDTIDLVRAEPGVRCRMPSGLAATMLLRRSTPERRRRLSLLRVDQSVGGQQE
jgi:hypothetical protein